jgi:hypothetical protein
MTTTDNENRTSLDDLKLFINVYDSACALAVAKSYTDENGAYCENVRYLDDLDSIGLSYSDLIYAIESQGAINVSGCYNCSNKILGAAALVNLR